MSFPIEKYLNYYTLGAMNLALILITELSGDFFEETGIIHLLSLLFLPLALGMYLRAGQYVASDHFLKFFLKITFLLLFIFPLIHPAEMLLQAVFSLSDETKDAFTLGAYLVSILGILAAAEYILSSWRRKTKWLYVLTLFLVFIFGFISFCLLAFWRGEESSAMITGVIALLVALAGVYSIFRIVKLKRVMPVLGNFIHYFSFAILFFTLSGLFEYFEINNLIGLPEVQNAYIAHFLIFATISVYILGLAKLIRPGGIYEDMKKAIENEENR